MTNLVCVIHHCRHPHDEPGSHQPPPVANSLLLKERTNWDVNFWSNIQYECPDGQYFENDEIDPTQNVLDVTCIDTVGEYNTPVKQGNSWPNCTVTVFCGQPLQPPINGTQQWISPASEFQESYETIVRYYCQNGSQFDTDNDGYGDAVFVDIRCQWNKQWSPYSESLPLCLVTHCVEPFKIPAETNLLELTSDWTPVNAYKEYECKNKIDSVHSMFWKSDRSKSTFKLLCYPDGYFIWEQWPLCIEDVTCSPDPPAIPTDPEYVLSSDDGTITINSLLYPVYPEETRTTNKVLDSTNNEIYYFPRNYMANLTYQCGSAREFFYSDGSQSASQTMTCQWDQSWTPTARLGQCDWIACLRPPTPPPSTNLVVTHWFGDPIQFGGQTMFVCKRGYHFEHDYHKTHVNFTCQDGITDGIDGDRGFFDVPENDEEWPNCVLSAMCPDPPSVPFEGLRQLVPLPKSSIKHSQCSIDGDILSLSCHSFETVFVTNLTYGRSAERGKDLCGGTKPPDDYEVPRDCFDESVNRALINSTRALCTGQYECQQEVPTFPLQAVCDGKHREIMTEYICGIKNNLTKFTI